MKLEAIIEHIKADASVLDPALLEREVGSFAIDSREVHAGDLFFSLSQPEYRNNGFNGDFADSTPYVLSAFAAGAACCVLRKDRFEEHRAALDEFLNRLLFVEDAIVALQQLAHAVYREWDKPVVAITGSAGKTTAKELTAHVLTSSGMKVLRNAKNYNNGLGHPLTVLRLAADETYDIAVLEMGMSTPMNEISRLCCITPPDIAVVLNVLPVHIEHLGTIEAIASAKGEIVQGMKQGGTAILNADDPRVAAMSAKSKGGTITYGVHHTADVRASDIRVTRLGETQFTLAIGGETAAVQYPLIGRHNVSNALAAAAVGVSLGMSLEDIGTSLATVAAPPQRGEILHFKQGFTIINDSYNSNPDALLSMVETMINQAPPGRRIVVAGEMLELGPEAANIHRETGAAITRLGVDMLIGVRGHARELVQGASDEDIPEASFAPDSESAGDLLVEEIKPGDTVLIKGSRGVRTERVVEKLLEKFELE